MRLGSVPLGAGGSPRRRAFRDRDDPGVGFRDRRRWCRAGGPCRVPLARPAWLLARSGHENDSVIAPAEAAARPASNANTDTAPVTRCAPHRWTTATGGSDRAGPRIAPGARRPIRPPVRRGRQTYVGAFRAVIHGRIRSFTRAGHTVTADLMFNEQDQRVDFTSDDRYTGSPDGKTFRRQRWSTPMHNYRTFLGRTISASGLGCWHTPEPKGPLRGTGVGWTCRSRPR
jgi:hypothetical protein